MSSKQGVDDMFDDDMDGELFGIPEAEVDEPNNKTVEYEDDDNEISISRIKAESGYINDEYVGVNKATQGIKRLRGENEEHEDDRSSIVTIEDDETMPSTVFTLAQKTFQPTSTPTHLGHRFMVWNNIGTIRSYRTEDDEGIDVTFHDPGHHQPIHLRNSFDYTMGCLSSDVVVFACLTDKDHPSKLFCINYGTWDSSKEWTVDMQSGENILAIGVGDNWIAAITDLNRLRLFSLSGIQHFVYEIPGQVVAIVGFNSLLFLTYHFGPGANDCQSISYTVLKVKGSSLLPLMQHLPLPLTPKSTLTWIGFSEEGTPAFSDSSDCLRILNGQLWTPFCNMREFLSGAKDHFWVTGLSQLGQSIRAVKCKGAMYPPTLPRPTELILEAKIPLCELDTGKSQLEDQLLRALLMRALSKKMETQGFDTEDYQEKASKNLLTTAFKLFELSITGNRDLRASEYISMTPHLKGVEAAVRLASQPQHRKNALVERLRKIAIQKRDEGSDNEEDYDDFEKPANSSAYSAVVPASRIYENTSSASEPVSYCNAFEPSTTHLNSAINGEVIENPLLRKQQEEIRNICSPLIRKSNPFKKTSTEEIHSETPTTEEKGFAFIDAWKKPAEKRTATDPFDPKCSKGKPKRRKKDDKNKS